MSTDVEPPERTSRSGMRAATASRSAFFFSPVGSQAIFASRGGLAESGERDLRAAILEDVAPRLGLPEAEATRLLFDGGQRAGLLVVGERVRVHRADAAVLEPVVLRPAGGHEVEAVEGLGIRCGQPLDDLRLELLELAARDDRHLDARRELEQELADAGSMALLEGASVSSRSKAIRRGWSSGAPIR
jgi:hypothetical protein